MSAPDSLPRVSIIVPAFNAGRRIERCLAALRAQDFPPTEIIVVNDGSTDDTLDVLARHPDVKVITQANSGPAAARNRGAREASGDVIVFTDDDCEPVANWLSELVKPLVSADVVGTKGVYLTRQRQIVARFVQLDYEDRYRLMARRPTIDFIDTYSAAFRRDRFLEMKGFDASFPVACAEDVELSYRMSKAGWKLKFVPAAAVYHQHPTTIASYLRKKFKFAFWRVLAVRKNPAKAVSDSHTPQIMKLQMLLAPAMLLALVSPGDWFAQVPVAMLVVLLFIATTLPFSIRAFRKDPLVALFSPLILAARAFAQFAGVICGTIRTFGGSRGDVSEPVDVVQTEAVGPPPKVPTVPLLPEGARNAEPPGVSAQSFANS